jgi:SAM-dependent methyltransferase
MSPGCRLCGQSNLATILDAGPMPLTQRLLLRADEGEERFPFVNCVCRCCGLVQIPNPVDPALLYSGYNYNFSSWKTEAHQDDELDRIFAAGKPASAIEIGCNDGKFLAELRDRGVERCIGIEPNPISSQMARDRGLPVVTAWADSELCRRIVKERGLFDFVIARQVLEHVPDINGFFECVRVLLASDGLLFVDVPDFAPALGLGDCSVMWEEHCNYFTKETLTSLLRRMGFDPFDAAHYDFAGGTVAILSRRSRSSESLPGPAAVSGTLTDAAMYAERIGEFRRRLQAALLRAKGKGLVVVLYGVGVRGCAAANILHLGGLVDIAVDDREERQGKYMPGSRLAIAASNWLAQGDDAVLCLLAVNNEYEAQVRDRISAMTSRRVEYATLCGPADIWADLARIEQI